MMTITATYRTTNAMLNAIDDLINRGIPREQIFWVANNREVKVTIPAVGEPEVNESLIRHRPGSLCGSSGRNVGSFYE